MARIRTVGLTGVANRFVELHARALDGGRDPRRRIADAPPRRAASSTSTSCWTRSIPPTRGRLQRIIRNGEKVFKGRTTAANEGARLPQPRPLPVRPARARSSSTTARRSTSLIRDGRDHRRRARLARRRHHAGHHVDRHDAARRRLPARGPGRRPAPRARAAQPAGRRARRAAPDAQPRAARPARGPPGGAEAGRRAAPARPRVAPGRPGLRKVNRLLPPLRRGLNGLPATAAKAVPALRSTVETLITLMPIVDGLRPYTPEIVNGVVSGLGARAAGYYDANGDYARIQVNAPAQRRDRPDQLERGARRLRDPPDVPLPGRRVGAGRRQVQPVHREPRHLRPGGRRRSEARRSALLIAVARRHRWRRRCSARAPRAPAPTASTRSSTPPRASSPARSSRSPAPASGRSRT